MDNIKMNKLTEDLLSTDFSIVTNKKSVIKNLEKVIKYHRDQYYNQQPVISDPDFDKLFDGLQFLDPENKLLEETGSDIPEDSPWEKAKHEMPMFSLTKMHTLEDYKKFEKDMDDNIYIIEEKHDGISIELIYNDGVLTQAITRGKGVFGEDITRNVVKMKNVALNIPVKDRLSFRAEIILYLEHFLELDELRFQETGKRLVNMRNAAAGVAKRQDGKYSNFLSLVYYDVWSENDLGFKFERDKLKFIASLNLRHTQYKIVKSSKEAYEYYEVYKKKRPSLDYDIDGLVVKLNNLKSAKVIDEGQQIPKSQRAWKFPNMQLLCQIFGVEWQLEHGEKLTPVAKLKPIFVILPDGTKEKVKSVQQVIKAVGSKINNATMNNIEWIKERQIGIMDIVLVEKANDIIPKIIKVTTKNSQKTIEAPNKCPRCDSEIQIVERFAICHNPKCPAKQLDILVTWKNTLEIKHIGDSITKKLFDLGLLKTVPDYYTIQVEDIANIDGLGEKSANKILDQFHNKKEIDLATFIAGLAIDGFGLRYAEKLVDAGFDTLDKILDLISDGSVSERIKIKKLMDIDGFAEKTSMAFIQGIKDREDLINDLLDVGIKIKTEQKVLSSSKLENLTFCITGTLSRKRKEVEQDVKDNGGKIAGVSAKLSYLIAGDSAGSKLSKADKLGIKVLSEEQFYEMINS